MVHPDRHQLKRHMINNLSDFWREPAVCLHRAAFSGTSDWEIVVQGTLGCVVDEINHRRLDQIKSLKIALPDRRIAPVGFNGSEIWALLKARRQGVALSAGRLIV
jgi:hypothetical protein